MVSLLLASSTHYHKKLVRMFIYSGCSLGSVCLFLLVHINRRGPRTMWQEYDRDMEEKKKKEKKREGRGRGASVFRNESPWGLHANAT